MTIIADDDVDDVEALLPPSVDVSLSMRHIILSYGVVMLYLNATRDRMIPTGA